MRKPAPLLIVAGFCLLIFSSKLWLIEVAGSDLPTWDQWDSQGEITYRPWLEGRLTANQIVSPHAEHRIVTTKLFLLGLLASNGQWDAFVETTANAIVHTLAALVLLLLARRWLQGGWLVLFATLLLLLFTLPFADDNTLVGFQVQFYFLLLFSLGHIALTLESDRFGWRWGIGQLCGLLAIISMASGMLSALAVLGVLGHRATRERRWTPQHFASALLAVLLVSAGLMLKGDGAGHEWLMAQNSWQFFDGFLRMLTWPGSRWLPFTIVLVGPTLVFLTRRVRQPRLTFTDAVLLGLLLWTLLQFAATAYARAVSVLTSRYLDLVAVHVMLGFVFLARELAGRTRRIATFVWLAVVLTGLGWETRERWQTETEPAIARHRRREANVRAFLHTGDEAHLLNKPFGDIPYPSGETLRDRLQPSLQTVMPASVRRPLRLDSPGRDAPELLPPALTPPPFATVVSTWAPESRAMPPWRSAVQPATSLPVLRFLVAGDLGESDRQLRLVVKSAAGMVEVLPDTAPGLRWKTVNVFRPTGEWWVDAEDADPNAWFAFTAPIEIGRWSWFARKLLKHHFAVMTAGGLLILLGGGALLLQRRDREFGHPMIHATSVPR